MILIILRGMSEKGLLSHLHEISSHPDKLSAPSGASKELAMKTVGQPDWTPSISGADLIKARTKNSQLAKKIGAVSVDTNLKIEDAVNVRFLP